MKYWSQVAQGADTMPLLLNLQRRPDLWDRNPCRLSEKGPHSETRDIVIRNRDETPHLASGDWTAFSGEHIPEWYESADHLPAVMPLIYDLMARVKSEMLGSVFVYKLPPGAKIKRHTDPGWHAGYFDKFNVCIQSNPSAAFLYDDEVFQQRAGDVHWFRNDVPHWVVNDGPDDHIVMVVSARLDRGKRVPWSPEGWTMDADMASRHERT